MRPAERAVLVGIVVVVAAALRVGFVATADVQAPLRADAGQYAQYAKNLVEHGVFSLADASEPLPDSFRSPGYPGLLALCRLVAGELGWYELARWLQVVLSSATVLLGHLLARRCVGFWPALAAAALAALSPHLVVAPAYVLTECTAAFVVTAALWLVLADRSRAVLAGAVLLGAAPLVNETLVFLPFVVAAALWRNDRRRAVQVLALALMPLALWTFRNQTTELARRGSERATASISHGSYPGMVYEDPRLFGFPYREDPAQPAFGASWENLFDVLGPRVAAAPGRYAKWYMLDKPVWLWSWPLVQGQDVYVYPVGNSPYERQPVVAATHTLMRWLHVPVMLLAAAGALWGIARGLGRRAPALLALGLVAVFATLAYLPVIPDPRYMQPFRVVLFVLAATAGASLLAGVRDRIRASADVASAGPAETAEAG